MVLLVDSITDPCCVLTSLFRQATLANRSARPCFKYESSASECAQDGSFTTTMVLFQMGLGVSLLLLQLCCSISALLLFHFSDRSGQSCMLVTCNDKGHGEDWVYSEGS